MKLIIQRVKQASVIVNSEVIGKISSGILVFLGVGKADSQKDADFLVTKIIQLRIFDDANGKMNLSALDVGAEFLVISQFTLYGDCKNGRRPSFDAAADPKTANELYEYFVSRLKNENVNVQTGRFAAMMDVVLVNDGPVTFLLDSGQLSAISKN